MTSATTDKAAEALEQLREGVAALTSSEDWRRMLETSAKFHRYSFGNQLLIALQRPDASRVAGFRRWLELGRQVRKGEKGLAILAPMTGKARKVDEQTGEEVETRFVRGFRVVHVFDVSQTDGEPLPDVMPELLAGDAPEGLFDSLAAIAAGEGFTVERGDCSPANGWTNHETKTIRVRDDVEALQAAKTMVHELAHALLHGDRSEVFACRGRVEVEAESVAYVALRALGLESSGYSFPYVAHWSGGKPDVVQATGDRVAATTRKILDALEASTEKEEAA